MSASRSEQTAPHLVAVSLSSAKSSKILQPDVLVPVTGLPAELAVKVTQGKTDPLDKARAIYDYVFTTMRYDKTGTGWGHGDVLYACDAKKGNCTDFHSLFIAMARSQGIPARFEIGFPLPPDKHSAEIAGYHCWSDFLIDGKGWIPVDISEAWKHPEKRDYFFGSHDVNRMQFSMGRDLRLSPPQEGKPLNYFVYPYVEVDGQEFSNVALAFSFADAGATVADAISQRLAQDYRAGSIPFGPARRLRNIWRAAWPAPARLRSPAWAHLVNLPRDASGSERSPDCSAGSFFASLSLSVAVQDDFFLRAHDLFAVHLHGLDAHHFVSHEAHEIDIRRRLAINPFFVFRLSIPFADFFRRLAFGMKHHLLIHPHQHMVRLNRRLHLRRHAVQIGLLFIPGIEIEHWI